MITIETENTVLAGTRPTAGRSHGYNGVAAGRTSADIPREEILAELDRIVASADFRASERNRRVLQYVVRCALEGREAEINAHAIATRVYGRAETFDSLKDPIVRIEMARLRRDLEMYYLKSGARNPLRLSIPKGRYLPKVTRAATADFPTTGVSASPFLVSVLRTSLLAWSGSPAAAAWQDLLLAAPNLLVNLQSSVAREIGDEEVTKLVVEGVLRAARRNT
jgi:hypothetical protein